MEGGTKAVAVTYIWGPAPPCWLAGACSYKQADWSGGGDRRMGRAVA